MTFAIPTWMISNLDFVAYGFLAYGIYQFGKFHTDGFFWAMIGSILLIAWGIYCHHWGTISWNILFALLYFSAYKNGRNISNTLNQIIKKDTN